MCSAARSARDGAARIVSLLADRLTATNGQLRRLIDSLDREDGERTLTAG